MTLSKLRHSLHVTITLCVLVFPAHSSAFTMQLGNKDTVQTPIAGNVLSFRFTIDIDAPLVAGVYENPPIVQIDYRVSGVPRLGSPSGFDAFALSQSFAGTGFYNEGNELVFEIAETAVLSDGVQAAELVGLTVILSFDARQEGTGRFHPPRLELRADGTGRLQNSDNIPDIADLAGISAGIEYITDIAFDPGNLTLMIEDSLVQPDTDLESSAPSSSTSSGVSSILILAMLALITLVRAGMPTGLRINVLHSLHKSCRSTDTKQTLRSR